MGRKMVVAAMGLGLDASVFVTLSHGEGFTGAFRAGPFLQNTGLTDRGKKKRGRVCRVLCERGHAQRSDN